MPMMDISGRVRVTPGSSTMLPMSGFYFQCDEAAEQGPACGLSTQSAYVSWEDGETDSGFTFLKKTKKILCPFVSSEGGHPK